MTEQNFKFDMLPPPEMAQAAATSGLRKVQMDFMSMMLLGILAGAFIGLGADFYTMVMIGRDAMPWGIAQLVGGFAFCLGLILVVVGGAELFTGNTMIVMAVASGKVAVRYLIRNWIITYIGNFIGAVGLAWLVCQAGQHNILNDCAIGKFAMKVANSKCSLEFWPAFFRGILCNGLVCLAVWLCYSARSTIDKIAAIIFPITAFVACGFEHCVANMYFIGAGLFIQSATGSVDYPQLTWYNFLVANLLPVTIGNIIGGSGLVGMVLWVIYCRRTPKYRDEMK